MGARSRVRLVVAYDGSDFYGWAPQRERRTVHGTLTETVRQISGEDCEIVGASRTDSGAHARGQVCHFDTTKPIPVERWKKALNDILPRDLVVRAADRVSADFHSRFWADQRWYRYRIQVGERDPRRARFAHHVRRQPNVEAMHDAAQRLVGVHDFLAFSQLVEPGKSTVRELYRLEVARSRDEVRLDVWGTAFVRGMMRRIAGCLLEIGLNERDPSTIESNFAAKRKEEIDWPTVLPACGLTLETVYYGRHPYDRRRKIEDRDEQDDE